MTWFLIAALSPLMFAITNHIDKALLSRYFPENGVGVLLIFSALASAMALPVIFVFDTDIMVPGLAQQFGLALAAAFNIALLWLYLTALDDSDPTTVIVFYQLVPVFGAVLGYLLLDEILTFGQIGAMAVVMFGAAIASFDAQQGQGVKLRKKTALCMAGASLCWAASATVFKMVALDIEVLPALFWEHVALTAFGVLIYLASKRYRDSFHDACRRSSAPIVALNLVNEGLYILGNVAAAFAYLMVPISFVLLTETLQPIMVFGLGLTLAVISPKWATEQLTRRDVVQKSVAILIASGGTAWLISQT